MGLVYVVIPKTLNFSVKAADSPLKGDFFTGKGADPIWKAYRSNATGCFQLNVTVHR